MEYLQTSQNLLDFISRCTSPFHVIAEVADMLSQAGYVRLDETKEWTLNPGENYYVIRNGSSIIAFQIPAEPWHSYQIMASHSDCPVLKVKGENPFVTDSHYTRLNVEGYGGMIRAPWFDRPLSVAGRMILKKGDTLESVLVDAKRDLVLIPNMPIHLNREMNEGIKYSIQKDMLPILGDETAKDHFYELFLPGVDQDQILGMDLYLYSRVAGSIWGADMEYISSGRLDDLQSAYGSLTGFLKAKTNGHVNVCCIFDNEEVGSLTKQGADSTFLTDTLQHINEAKGAGTVEYHRDLAGSFLVSADNAHAFHPAHPEKYDVQSRVYMNHGIVIKQSANQKYTTDALSEAVIKMICRKAGIPCQVFANHSDIPGGSTLGAILNSLVSVASVDIGMAQLSMHSPYETAGAKDTEYLAEFSRCFYETELKRTDEGGFRIMQ
ncbi:MAG: M18 family aminopeptidase [Fusicatenibacter sp.]